MTCRSCDGAASCDQWGGLSALLRSGVLELDSEAHIAPNVATLVHDRVSVISYSRQQHWFSTCVCVKVRTWKIQLLTSFAVEGTVDQTSSVEIRAAIKQLWLEFSLSRPKERKLSMK